MGYSRDSFYRFKELYEQGGEAALQEIGRRRPNHKNRVESRIEEAIVALTINQRAKGQLRVTKELAKQGIAISQSGGRVVWLRHDLATMRQRLKALEAQVAQEGVIPTEPQLAALERGQRAKKRTVNLRANARDTAGRRIRFMSARLGRRSYLSADLHRHLLEGLGREALH